MAPWFKPIVGFHAAMLMRSGDAEKAALVMRQLLSSEGHADPIGSAIFHLLRGDMETAAHWTEKAIEARQPAVFFFLHEHATSLQSTPHWPKLAQLMNLPG